MNNRNSAYISKFVDILDNWSSTALTVFDIPQNYQNEIERIENAHDWLSQNQDHISYSHFQPLDLRISFIEEKLLKYGVFNYDYQQRN